MVTQEDTIFVSGMDPSISEEEICQHFGAIGVIKVCIYVCIRNWREEMYFELNERDTRPIVDSIIDSIRSLIAEFCVIAARQAHG